MKKYIYIGFWRITPIFLLTFAFFFLADFKFASAAQISSATISSMTASSETPLYIYIPSINLSTKVQGVGIDSKGNMDVPSGKSKNVGWYKYGTAPGKPGTAVFDAHNTAAFKDLDSLKEGENVFIYTTKGEWLQFTVTKTKTYPIEKLSPSTLFASTKSKQINLITCAGELLGNGEATHRLIVSAELV